MNTSTPEWEKQFREKWGGNGISYLMMDAILAEFDSRLQQAEKRGREAAIGECIEVIESDHYGWRSPKEMQDGLVKALQAARQLPETTK